MQNMTSIVALIIASIALFDSFYNHHEERIVRAWQLLTTQATGNSGKIQALEYLNSQSPPWRSWLPLSKKQVALEGINLTPPALISIWRGKTKEEQKLPEEGCPQNTYLLEAELTNAYLRKAVLACSDLYKAKLSGAHLVNADLRGADLWLADLQRANLKKADLRRANLQGTNLRGANLEGANLQRAYLSFADLKGANLKKLICGRLV